MNLTNEEKRAARKHPKTPWQKIVRAAKRGTGLRLTSDEIEKLSWDDAIQTRASIDDDNAKGMTDEEANPSSFTMDKRP